MPQSQKRMVGYRIGGDQSASMPDILQLISGRLASIEVCSRACMTNASSEYGGAETRDGEAPFDRGIEARRRPSRAQTRRSAPRGDRVMMPRASRSTYFLPRASARPI